jgi:hypothetical protein
MNLFEDPSVALIAAFVLFFLTSIGVVLVLWIALPFSVFGIKGSLKKSIGAQEESNRLLKSILETLERLEGQGRAGPGTGGTDLNP